MMACRRRVSVSFWATGWSCTIPIRPTWATGGRIPRSTTILRSFRRRCYGWGSTCSLTPWARRGDRHCPSAAAARRAARPRPRRSRAALERGRRVCDRGSGADARAARRGGGGGVAPDRGDSRRRGVAGAPGGAPRPGRPRGAAGRDDRREPAREGGGGAPAWLVRRAGRPGAAAAVGRLVETTAGTRAGSVVGVLAPAASAGASAELLGLADARAAAVVERAAPAVGRLLARGTRTSLMIGAGTAALGAVLFVASSPGAGRAAAFWHPLRAMVDARAPVRLAVDRATVRRGDSVTVTLEVPAATRAILWTRGPGEPWRAAPIALDSLGRATRRVGPLE